MTGTALMLSISSGLAGLIAAICVPVTIALAIATLLLLRDLRRADRQAVTRGGEIEHLRDEIWQARESEERYRSLIEGQNDLISRRDEEGRLVYANAVFLEAAGQTDAVIGKRFALAPLRSSEALLTSEGARSFDHEIETPRGRR